MAQQTNGIIEFIRKIIDMIFGSNKEKPDNAMNADTKPEKKLFESSGYKFEHDKLVQAKSFSTRLFPKNLAVIHFSWTETLQAMSDYFSKWIAPNSANSTWGVGKNGTVHRYLPDIRYPSWTSNSVVDGHGIYAKYIDTKGKPVTGTYVNDHSCAFEVVNRNYTPYTEQQYIVVVKRLLYMLDVFPDFRLWRILGHEHCVPLAKDDPGKHWDWEKMFAMCGMSENFYRNYMTFLKETAGSTVGDVSRSDRKQSIIREALAKIGRDLSDKPKDFCF